MRASKIKAMARRTLDLAFNKVKPKDWYLVLDCAHLNVYALATGAASPGYTLVPRAGIPRYTFVPRAGSPEYTPVIGLVALIT